LIRHGRCPRPADAAVVPAARIDAGFIVPMRSMVETLVAKIDVIAACGKAYQAEQVDDRTRASSSA
jgi:hypothetical protein